MKISVLALASRSGGGLTILRDLYDFANTDESDTQWQFVVSDQDIEQQREGVEVARAVADYRGWPSRIRAEMTTARTAIAGFDPDVVLSLQNMDSPARGRRPLAIYMQQAMPFAEEKFSLRRTSERPFWIRQRLLRALIRGSIRRAEVTFVQTKWMEQTLSDACPNSDIRNIGFELESSSSSNSFVREPTKSLVYPASAAVYKDHETLHRAVSIWRETCPDPGPVVVTLTKEAFQLRVGKLSHNEESWYRFVGTLSREDLSELYLNSIVLFPSYIESLGLPLYEGMQHGCKVVAADIAASKEALSDYPGAYLFRRRSAESMAKQIEFAWNSRNERVTPKASYHNVKVGGGGSWSRLLWNLNQIGFDGQRPRRVGRRGISSWFGPSRNPFSGS